MLLCIHCMDLQFFLYLHEEGSVLFQAEKALKLHNFNFNYRSPLFHDSMKKISPFLITCLLVHIDIVLHLTDPGSKIGVQPCFLMKTSLYFCRNLLFSCSQRIFLPFCFACLFKMSYNELWSCSTEFPPPAE